MKVQIQSVIIVLNVLSAKAVVLENVNSTDIAIKELEKQKNALFHEINVAIEDTVNSLKEYNNSDALLALNHIQELKKQIKEYNETEDKGTSKEIYEGSETEVDTQKRNNESSLRRQSSIVSQKNKHLKLELSEILTLLHKKGEKNLLTPKQKKLEENRKILQEKLELWVKQHEREKARIKRLQAKQNEMAERKTEKCPDDGTKRVKKRKTYRRKGKKMRLHVYPCCRKCCKKSDIGCL